MRRRNPRPIDVETALAVARKGIAAVEDAGGRAAIGGGLAMLLHGLVRNTADVDIIASMWPKKDPGKYRKALSFGGGQYLVEGEELDIIIREDNKAELYEFALEDVVYKKGVPVISAAWLVVMKFVAGRPKDLGDLHYLITSKKAPKKEILANARKAGGWFMQQELENAIEEAMWTHSRNKKK